VQLFFKKDKAAMEAFRRDLGPLPLACINGGAWIANGAVRVSGNGD
jgi:hypothetical protein